MVILTVSSLSLMVIFFLNSALIGASMFISTVVLGTIILVVKIRPEDIGMLPRTVRSSIALSPFTHQHFLLCCLLSDKIDFVRDVSAYILVVALVVGVACDGTVSPIVIKATPTLLTRSCPFPPSHFPS